MIQLTYFGFRRRRVRAVLIGTLLAFVAGLAGWYFKPWSRTPRHLLQAYSAQKYRAFDGRLAGGFGYRPLATATRGAVEAEIPVLAAAAAMQRTERASHNATTVHRLAISYLLLGSWDRAIDLFDTALRLSTERDSRAAAISACGDGGLLNDVAAAYHAHGRHRNQSYSYVIAAEAAQRAWTLDRNAEAAWNRALAAEALYQHHAAKEAWRDYLAIDDASAWADEARSRLARLTQPAPGAAWKQEETRLTDAVNAGDRNEITRIVRAFPFESRMLAEHTYLPEWAAKFPAPMAEERLAFCRAVGRVLRETSGESMLADRE